MNENCESNHKEYPCTANIIISLDTFRTGIFLLDTHSKIVYYNYVKFHQYKFILYERVVLTRHCTIKLSRLNYLPCNFPFVNMLCWNFDSINTNQIVLYTRCYFEQEMCTYDQNTVHITALDNQRFIFSRDTYCYSIEKRQAQALTLILLTMYGCFLWAKLGRSYTNELLVQIQPSSLGLQHGAYRLYSFKPEPEIFISASCTCKVKITIKSLLQMMVV